MKEKRHTIQTKTRTTRECRWIEVKKYIATEGIPKHAQREREI